MSIDDEIRKINSWPLLSVTFLGAMTFGFGLAAAWWWIAQQIGWWQYGLASCGGVLVWSAAKTVWQRRRR